MRVKWNKEKWGGVESGKGSARNLIGGEEITEKEKTVWMGSNRCITQRSDDTRNAEGLKHGSRQSNGKRKGGGKE